MTQMPQMVALFNGVGGGAVALIAWVEFRECGGFADVADLRRDLQPVRGDRRQRVVLGLEHRLRQAAGAHRRAADQRSGRRSSSVNVALLAVAVACGVAIVAGSHGEILMIVLLVLARRSSATSSCCRSAAPTCRS